MLKNSAPIYLQSIPYKKSLIPTSTDYENLWLLEICNLYGVLISVVFSNSHIIAGCSQFRLSVEIIDFIIARDCINNCPLQFVRHAFIEH